MLLSELAKAIIKRPETAAAFKYFRAGAGEGTKADFELKNKLVKMGWSLLSSDGLFSSVFSNPRKKYVLKINHNKDSGYETFVKLIHAHPNKYFPRISDMKKLTLDIGYGEDNYYVYLIEKLKPIPQREAIKLVNMLDKIFYKLQNTKIENISQNVYKLFNYNIPDIMNDVELFQAIWLLANEPTQIISTWDMHSGNIMQRKDGSLVIIDPYA